MRREVIVLAGPGDPGPASIYWMDHLRHDDSPWGTATLTDPLRSVGGIFRFWNTLQSLSAAKLIITLHNSLTTNLVMFLKLIGLINAPIVVLELNVKFQELSLLAAYLAPLLYSKAHVVTVLSPSDRDAMLALPGWRNTHVCVLNQWAQLGAFQEAKTGRVMAILEKAGPKYAIAPGRSSRNFDELFHALPLVPEARVIIVGHLRSPIPKEVRSQVLAIAELGFHEYIYLLRRARLSLIPLFPVQHTCGIRVWFQSNALGIPVIITLTEPILHYSRCGALALFYRSGEAKALGEHLARLWNDDALHDSLSTRSLAALESGFGVEAYHTRVVELAGAVLRCESARWQFSEEWQWGPSGVARDQQPMSPTKNPPTAGSGAACDCAEGSGQEGALS